MNKIFLIFFIVFLSPSDNNFRLFTYSSFSPYFILLNLPFQFTAEVQAKELEKTLESSPPDDKFIGSSFYNTESNSKIREIVVSSKIFTENILLAEMLSLILEENYNFKVIRKFNLGGTKLIFDALV
ncbi:MAG: hypothetical protein OXC37_02535, partial [Bdellovibrionaceae bacterium]|nr:hypothetical protein [Pseudobdellovibrionaceae bacterium]